MTLKMKMLILRMFVLGQILEAVMNLVQVLLEACQNPEGQDKGLHASTDKPLTAER